MFPFVFVVNGPPVSLQTKTENDYKTGKQKSEKQQNLHGIEKALRNKFKNFCKV
jgi:hypothetical protein